MGTLQDHVNEMKEMFYTEVALNGLSAMAIQLRTTIKQLQTEQENKMTTLWTEETSTKNPFGFNWFGQHSSTEKSHQFRWVYSDGSPASEWVVCNECGDANES